MENGELDIIEELYGEEEELAAIRAEELRQTEIELREEETGDMQELIDVMLVCEAFITSVEAHKTLKKELIGSFSWTGNV